MVIVSGKWKLFGFVWKYGSHHASPNSGYPEAALAGILHCRFGGLIIISGSVLTNPSLGKMKNCWTRVT